MSRIDLDDLPPKVAQALKGLAEGEELILVQGGAVVGRLVAAETAPPEAAEPLSDLSPEDEVAEVLEHFGSIINDEF
jgi:antitoxin (DNA-binding transcriptional repressor) of toxin-antitoxin stability system